MRAAGLVIAALMLAACGGGPPASLPEATLPPGLQGDIEGRGTEPFWAVKTAGDRIILERPEHPPLTLAAEPPREEAGAAIWDGAAADPPVRVAARVQPGCSDGMSDLVYPLAVEVTIGGETLKGCGARAGEMPRGQR